MTAGDSFWRSYFRGVFQTRRSWLDDSNDRVPAHTFGLVLDSAGPISGKRCVDVGCGWGQLARTLHNLGAREVTAIDLVAEPIAELARAYPHIRWLCGDISAVQVDLPRAGTDLLLMIEVLQYMPFATTMGLMWELIAPGGRVVAIVPNADRPIVVGTKQHFSRRYAAPTTDDVCNVLPTLRAVETWGCRGLMFGEDQTIAPYLVTPWTQAARWERQPNRLQLVATKRT